MVFGEILNELNYVNNIPGRWNNKLENIDCSRLLLDMVSKFKITQYLALKEKCILVDVEIFGSAFDYLHVLGYGTNKDFISVLLKGGIENPDFLNQSVNELSIPLGIRKDPKYIETISVSVPIENSVEIKVYDSSELLTPSISDMPKIIKINPKYPLAVTPYSFIEVSGRLNFTAPKNIHLLKRVDFCYQTMK